MAATPVRNVRVPDELWDAAKRKAWLVRTDLTAVIVYALEQFVGEDDERGVSYADFLARIQARVEKPGNRSYP